MALRADLDALPLSDEKHVPYRSTVPNACHACGHDVHTTIAARRGAVPGPAGRRRAAAGPGPADLPAGRGGAGRRARRAWRRAASPPWTASSRCTATRGWTSGKIGIRAGPITAACDKITVRVTGPGGHTARPHLTADLVYALGKIVTELPAALSRRVDPRSSLSLVWGRVSAGTGGQRHPR